MEKIPKFKDSKINSLEHSAKDLKKEEKISENIVEAFKDTEKVLKLLSALNRDMYSAFIFRNIY